MVQKINQLNRCGTDVSSFTLIILKKQVVILQTENTVSSWITGKGTGLSLCHWQRRVQENSSTTILDAECLLQNRENDSSH